MPAPYSRKNPCPARMVVNQKLSVNDPAKDTRHFELSLGCTGLQYLPGDSMGVFAQNDPTLVDEILHALQLSGEEEVTNPAKQQVPLRQALLNDFIITQPDKKFLKAIVAKAVAAPLLAGLMTQDKRSHLADYLFGMEVIDFLLEHPSVTFSAEEFVGLLRKLQPRLYSIASSQAAVGEEVHFTVVPVRYRSHGRDRSGVCSVWLADRVTPETPVKLFVHSAKGFRLPEDPATPIIMVGPGTGIAPFRAFLQERQVTQAPGRNWLFFGEWREKANFFYQEELESLQASGVLTRLSSAFSRDQDEKVYVQHRLLEEGADVWRWLEEGAHFYVCGDASRMAKDVDSALHEIVCTHGAMDDAAASKYVEQLKNDKRYKRDVY